MSTFHCEFNGTIMMHHLFASIDGESCLQFLGDVRVSYSSRLGWEKSGTTFGTNDYDN